MSELLTELERDLGVSETLVSLGALTVGEVEGMLRAALSYVQRVQAFDGDARDEQTIYRTQLNSEIDLLSKLDRAGAAPADQWPRQRRALERAYYWSEANGALWDAAAADSSARKKALDDLLERGAGAAKKLATGLEDVLKLVVLLVVVLVIAQFAGKARTA